MARRCSEGRPWRSADLAALCVVQPAKIQIHMQISEPNSVPKESGGSENSSVENQREQKNVNKEKKRLGESTQKTGKMKHKRIFLGQKAFFCTQASLTS